MPAFVYSGLKKEPNQGKIDELERLDKEMKYMTDFKDKISKLKSDLEAVNNEIDEYEKCKKLNKIFGDDFEVPNETEVAKHQLNYIPSSSSSGL